MESRKTRDLSGPAREAALRQISEVLAARPEIVFAYAHGSFLLRGPFRDIDLAVWVRPDVASARHPLDYEVDLGMDLQRVVGIPVDVKRLNEAPLSFRYHATRGRSVLCRDEEIRDAWVERVRDAYWDFQPVAQQHLTELLRE